jgi:hypothetical protein
MRRLYVDYPGHVYLPEELAGKTFYEPGTEGAEPELAERWRNRGRPQGKP